MKRTLVKICGITNIEDAEISLDYGADMLGFIFHEKSPRYIPPERAGEIISNLKHRYSFESVGVFVNPPEDLVKAATDKASPDILQFHGEEPVKLIKSFNKKTIKAFRIKSPDDLRKCEEYSSADFLLLDTFSKDSYGGTGMAFDWGILNNFKYREKLFLSGGININNIEEALRKVKPYAIDLSSSLEKKPGLKDAEKIKEFFAVFKTANP